MELRLATVTPDNVAAACRLTIRPEQEGVVAPVAFSLAEVVGELVLPAGNSPGPAAADG